MRYGAIFVATTLALAGCSSSSSTANNDAGTGTPDYASVSAILGGREQPGIGACAASSCHGGDQAGHGGMNFKTAKDLRALLVNVPACENSSLMRVKPGDPDHSWLWIKLTAPIHNTIDGQLTYSGTPSTCSGVSTGFGTRMPQVYGTFDKLSDAQLALVKGWIEAGAPGPKP
ncbi:MAG TPA: hypothetical protein VF331_25210 [Polyangiales bacterium]